MNALRKSALLLALLVPLGITGMPDPAPASAPAVSSASPSTPSGQVLPTSQLRTEEQLLAVLKSEVSLEEKDAAFAELKRVATAKSIPVLAALLTQPAFSHSARYVLETLPAPEAGTALIEALGKTSGLLKVGIIDSLARRRDPAAVGAVAPLLQARDPDVFRASVVALGRMGGSLAFDSLIKALDLYDRSVLQSTPAGPGVFSPRSALLASLVETAYGFLKTSRRADASSAFARILATRTPDHARMAAYQGLILSAGPSEAAKLVKKAILGTDAVKRTAAIEAAGAIDLPRMTRVLTETLPGAPAAVKVPLIEALRQRGDPGAAPAILAEATNADPAVRISALGALGDLGDEKALSLLLVSAHSDDEAESRAARQALLDIRRGPIADALISSLKTGDAATQAEASRALAGRGDPAAVPGLISVARGDSANARSQALATLGRLAKPDHIKDLVALVVSARDEETQGQAGEALRSACERLDGWGVRVDPAPLVAALGTADEPARAALLPATASFRDGRVRASIRASMAGPRAIYEAAFAALTETQDPDLLPDLAAASAQSPDQTGKIRALRGYIRLAANIDDSLLPPAQRVAALRKILPTLTRPEERWLMLAGLAKIPDTEALELALPMMDDPATKAEAAEAVLKIAAALPVSQPGPARAALDKVLARVSDPAQRRAAADAVRRLDEAAGTLPRIAFKRLTIDAAFRSEGLAVADFDRDGRLDIATGNILYIGPDWKPQPMLAAAKEYKPEEYSNEFLCFAEDIDRDGWTDLVVVGFPGAQTRWLRNPGKSAGPWQEFLAVEKTGNESPDWLDADGDGRKELVFVSEKGMAFARPGNDPKKRWAIQVIASPSDPAPGHGLGIGDINGDGRKDVLCAEGWWEGPARRTAKPWTFHKAKLGYEAAAQMLVLDVDGDGDADVVSSAAHRYGLWWYEKTPAGWVPHEIERSMSQLHALHAADLDGDGRPEIVTGKRFWAHREGDEGIDDPAILCWFEIRRAGGQVSWIRHDIDYDSGVGLHFAIVDVDGDGRLDIVTSNKKGVCLFSQERR